MRAFAAQTRVSKMAVKRYYRCLDDLTGAEYYFDPKTGRYCMYFLQHVSKVGYVYTGPLAVYEAKT